MARKTIEIFPGMSFGLVHDIDEHPKAIDFALHNHDNLYEIVMLVKGDCEFHVEGNIYKLCPYDVMLVRPFEMHHIVCLSDTVYDRIILYIKPEYFDEKNCRQFLDVLENRRLGTGNILSYNISERSLSECIKRLDLYAKEEQYQVMDGVLMEFLYLLNKAKSSAKDIHSRNERIRNVIMYINDNLDGDLSLDTIAAECYISKNYLCNLFKRYTGYTVNHYITYKRILYVQELYKNGKTLLQSCIDAGFKSYSGFYRAYVGIMGQPPKHMIK